MSPTSNKEKKRVSNNFTDVSCLRNEIIEAQKARTDFLKFKLLAIAALGAAGVGLQGSSKLGENIDCVFCIIPFVCVYVDYLCYHLNVRILIIAKYLDDEGDGYEKFVNKLCNPDAESKNKNSVIKNKEPRRTLFQMEGFVIKWTTLSLSVLLIVYGLISLSNYFTTISPFTWCSCLSIEFGKYFCLIIAGVIGVWLAMKARKDYDDRYDTIKGYKKVKK